ncbi:putative uncharacterized protein DDB_G0282133 [Aphis gossypii]|uniref:putative uncharacterized protein DDB_G0282133 n=1 Tax=Aphis gossypii TaxID=80765 RepID=UPI00215936E3|nr:putative uncharacterized protein DDB_G0282133 [Aphis gossypii]
MESRKSIKTYYGFLLVKKSSGTICGRFPLTKKECILGRDNKCDIRILLEKVSAQQCSILCIDNKAYVRDTSIAGSTKVNGKKVGRSNFLLHDSDEIEICERKFVWEYPKKPHGELNNLSCKKSGIRNDHLSPRVPERFSNQIITPLDNNKFATSSKSSMKTPSKTIISLNKTPIVVATENMSKSSFDKVQNNFQNQNSTTTAQPGSKPMKLHSMTPVRNIPLLRDSKSTPRKSWIVTNTSDNLSSIGAHNRLSTQRLKRDSTPELNSSYHYEDEDVEFDSPDPPTPVLDSEQSVDINIHDIVDNDLPIDNQLELNDQDNDNLQSNTDNINKLTVSELEPSTSRRDTYSIDNRSIVIEENTTPAPRRSILKCSKTTKPNRSRSSCRMVQFARLPKTDSKIKSTKSRLNSGFNFIVTDDENNLIDSNQSTKNSLQFDVEEYDDDLDGVQPLDISVSSLINSPILENSIKSSKRGSRGNKVMSLVNSIEKRTNESPKHSIRASDLLSMNGSKHTETLSNNNSPNNANLLQESVSSSRRINLEDIFEAEDSLKTTCNIENETKKSPVKNVEIVSSPKKNLLNITDTETIPVDAATEDESVNDINDLEGEYAFAPPLNLPSMNSSSITVNDSNLTFVGTEKNSNSTKIINQLDTNSKLDNSTEDCTTSINEFLMKSDNIESLVSPNNDTIDETQHDNSNHSKNSMDEKMCTIDIETPNNITESSKIVNPKEKEHSLKQKDDSEFVDDKCNNEVSTSKNDVQFAEKVKPLKDELNPKQNDTVKLINKSSDLNFDQIDKQSYVSKAVEQTLNGETPSIVVQSMSEMFNASIDEHETTHSQHKESLVETYILVGKDNLQNSLEINEVNIDKCNKKLSDKSVSSNDPLNNSIINAIEVQLDKIHTEINRNSNCNENKTIVDSALTLNKQKTLTSNLVLEETDTENPTLKINDHLSNNSSNTLTVNESTEIISNSVSILKSPAKDNVGNCCLTNVNNSNVSESSTKTAVDEPNCVQNINASNEESNSLTKTIPSDNLSKKNISLKSTKKITINLDQLKTALGANNSKESRKSFRSPIKESITPELRKINSTKKTIAELIDLSSSSDENENDQDKNLDHSLVTSIGRPRYESTPWNWSKSSKTPFNSTTSVQPNETTKDNFAENENRCRDSTPTNLSDDENQLQGWSQMMKDFNESVKKASVNFNVNINITGKHKKKLFVINSKDSNIKNDISEIKKKNSSQDSISSIMSHNISNESVQVIKPIRNESAQLRRSVLSDKRRSNRSTKIQTSLIDNYDSAENSNTNEKILPRKNNSIVNKIDSGTVQANSNCSTKSTSIISTSKSDNYATTSSSSKENSYACSQTKKITTNQNSSFNSSSPSTSVNKIESNSLMKKYGKVPTLATKLSLSTCNNETSSSSSSPNETQTFERELRRRKLNNCTSNNALSESNKLNLDKKNKMSRVVRSKSTKNSKTVKTKKSTNLKTNKNSRSKRLLPSKPIKTSSKDSSEYESSNETEESTQKVQSVDSSKSIKEKTKKKDVQIDNNLLSLPTRRSQRGKIKMSDVSIQPRTLSRKRAAIMSPLTQNSKDKKKVILSKALASPVSQTPNSPKNPSYALRRQNSTVNQIPDKSLPETTKKSSSLRILRTNKNAQLNHLLPSKPIKTSTKDSLECEIFTKTEENDQNPQLINSSSKSTKEKTKKKDITVDNNLSSLSTKRNLRDKNKTSDVSLQPPKTQSRKRAADTSPLPQPNAKGKKCDILSKAASTVSRTSNSPNIRTRNMSKTSIKQTSDNSFPETIIVSKKEKKISNEKVKPKSNENTRAKKRQLNSDNCSFDSAPSTRKKIRQVTFRGGESENKKSDSSTRSTSKLKIQNTDTSTEPIASLNIKNNKNAKKSISPVQRKTRNTEKSISPIQRKTRKAKQVAQKDKETIISPRVLRVREKKK